VEFRIGMDFSIRDRSFVMMIVSPQRNYEIRIASVHKEVAKLKILAQGKSVDVIVSRGILSLLGNSVCSGQEPLSLCEAVSNFKNQSPNCNGEYNFRAHNWANQCPCCNEIFEKMKTSQVTRWNQMFKHIKNKAEEGNVGELYCKGGVEDAHVFQNHTLNLAFFEVVQPLFDHTYYEMKKGFGFDMASMKGILEPYENKLSMMMVSILIQYPMPVECAAVYILGMNTCSEQLVKYLRTLAHAAERFSQTIDVRNVGKNVENRDELPKMVQAEFKKWVKAHFKRLGTTLTTPTLLTMYNSYTEVHSSYSGIKEYKDVHVPCNHVLENDTKFYFQLHLDIIGGLPAKKEQTKKKK